jgi:hypothetical protein
MLVKCPAKPRFEPLAAGFFFGGKNKKQPSKKIQDLNLIKICSREGLQPVMYLPNHKNKSGVTEKALER